MEKVHEERARARASIVWSVCIQSVRDFMREGSLEAFACPFVSALRDFEIKTICKL